MCVAKVRLYDIAKVIRTKNAGPFKLVIDIFFPNEDVYRLVKESNVLSKKLIAKLYNIPEDRVEGIYFVDSAAGVKITLIKDVASDDITATDVYGAQQHGPLIDLEINGDN